MKKFRLVLVCAIACLFMSSCHTYNHSMKTPNSYVEYHAEDFELSDQVTGEATVTWPATAVCNPLPTSADSAKAAVRQVLFIIAVIILLKGFYLTTKVNKNSEKNCRNPILFILLP